MNPAVISAIMQNCGFIGKYIKQVEAVAGEDFLPYHADNGLRIFYTGDDIHLYLCHKTFGSATKYLNIEIGTINDNTNTTFYGAWNMTLNYLIKNYPFAHIGIIVSNGCETDDYRVATIAVAKNLVFHILT